MKRTVLFIGIAVLFFFTAAGQELPLVQALNVYEITSVSAMADGEIISDGKGFIPEKRLGSKEIKATYNVDTIIKTDFEPFSDVEHIKGSMYDLAAPYFDPDHQNTTREFNSMKYPKPSNW